jgi:hypothetical protein
MDTERLPTAGDFSRPIPDGDQRYLRIGLCIDPVITGTENCERHIGRVDFHGLVVIQEPKVDIQRSSAQPNLRIFIIQVQKLKSGP